MYGIIIELIFVKLFKFIGHTYKTHAISKVISLLNRIRRFTWRWINSIRRFTWRWYEHIYEKKNIM